MSKYLFRIEGPQYKRTATRSESLVKARAEAVRFLGSYLAQHPDLSEEEHWRLTVEDTYGRPYLHVIVATVTDRNSPAE